MATFYGTANNDSLIGGADNDTLYGYGGNDFLYGSAGNDVLNGNAGNDFLNGNADNDLLNGNDGNDTLKGAAGYDTLRGGPGADRFFFDDRGDALDVITDFDHSEGDKIQISSSGFGTSSSSDFSYDNSTGKLFYLGQEFAALQSGLGAGFVPSLDIIFVD
jgi:Ca2+-binding RTX toxin-like protein